MKLCKPLLSTFTASLPWAGTIRETLWRPYGVLPLGPFLVPWINLAHGKKTFPAQVEEP